MHNLHGRLGIQLQTSSAIWSWALRHSAWLISRFSVVRGATAHELAFGRVFNGELCCESLSPLRGELSNGATCIHLAFIGEAELLEGICIRLEQS